jgi:transcriptional regulator with GAF, ATPase, and Fis domain
MGAAQSKSSSDTNIVNSAVSNIMISSASNCSSNTGTAQEMTISDLDITGCNLNISNIAQDANVKANFKCASDTQQNNNLVNQFANQLDQQLSASLSGIPSALISNAETETITNLKNEITNNINMSQIASCMSNNMISQKNTIGKLKVTCVNPTQSVDIKDISQKLVADFSADCIQQQKAVSDASSKLDTIIKQKQEAVNKGIDLGSLIGSFASLGASWFIWIIVLVCCCMCSSLSSAAASQGAKFQMPKDFNSLLSNVQTAASQVQTVAATVQKM